MYDSSISGVEHTMKVSHKSSDCRKRTYTYNNGLFHVELCVARATAFNENS